MSTFTTCRSRATITLLVLGGLAGSAAAQCFWTPGYGYPNSPLNGNIPAMISWDPPGPQGPILAVSSSFPQPSAPPVKLGFFDGSSWTAPPPGPRIAPAAFAVYQDKLIVGGFAGSATGPTIAAWDGSQWTELGSGLDGVVRALVVHEGSLYAGGEFFTAGGTSVNKIARWDGQQWHDVGGGVTGVGFPMVLGMLSAPGRLIVGGFFQTAGTTSAVNIAEWTGETWSALGAGRPSSVDGLAMYQGKVIAGGVSPIAQWDGENWQPMGTGLDQSARAFIQFQGDLIVGGFFQNAGGQSASRVARWNGTQWSPLGSGVAGIAFGTANVTSLALFQGHLCVGGFFDTAGGTPSVNFARWSCASCYANCDGSPAQPVLTANDFQCFINAYAAGSSYANCDGSTAAPVLTANDFQCFINAYAGGCR